MTRLVSSAPRRRARQGFTLIEVLVATTLTLMLIGAVVSVFELVSNSVSDARATLEMSDRLRSTAMQLQRDLAGVTVTMLPPRRPEDNEGYFEYIENSILTATGRGQNVVLRPDNVSAATPYARTPYAVDAETGAADLTVGDTDDILMFTTRSPDRPFVGRYGAPTGADNVIESQVAEVAWFLRGRTLYRRQLLVLPGLSFSLNARGFYANYDLSVHADSTGRLVPNTLGDLTKREYRFAHPYNASDATRYRATSASGWPCPFPFDVRRWGLLRLPTVCETTSNGWSACFTFPTTGNVTSPGVRMPAALPQRTTVDMWRGPDGIVSDGSISAAQAFDNANAFRVANPWHRNYWDADTQRRCMDDVMLTNVIGFDVKAWDPGAPLYSRNVSGSTTRTIAVAPGDPGFSTSGSRVGYGAYVDLGYLPSYTAPRGAPQPRFNDGYYGETASSQPRSGLYRVYDTWSTHYEYDGIAQFGGRTDWATDGIDNDNKNGVDDAGERETKPPYPYPLRSIQVKIRTFEPDSRQIRETTIIQDFVPQ
jgi:prepilin-type N-terminal cleavage/methylation domain-containing protein